LQFCVLLAAYILSSPFDCKLVKNRDFFGHVYLQFDRMVAVSVRNKWAMPITISEISDGGPE
ncbi:hypothetical protein, partial [Escherichia coli]|uniref:hypothetical protein n=1 Tax=Escherichia coli TaxID=562 RepID=UPI00321AED41